MLFSRNSGDGADGNGERDEVSTSGLTMLHQALLHTSTTLSETLDRGLEDVKNTNTAAHSAVAKELARMAKETQKLAPLPYSDHKSGDGEDTAEDLNRLQELVSSMQATLVGLAQDVASLVAVPVPVTVTAGEGNGYAPAAAETAHAGRSVLDGVPRQRSDSATVGTPQDRADPAPAGGVDAAHPPAAEPEDAVEGEPDDRGGPQAGLETEAPLTRNEAVEAVREEPSEEAEPPLTRDQVAEVVREVMVEELAPLLAALPAPAVNDAPSAVAELGGQIADLREEVASLVERLPAAQQGEGEAHEHNPEHSKVLTQAAGISSAVLVCHRDLWELLSGWAGGHPHFRMPPRIADQGENRIAADISGRSLIAVLISLFHLKQTATNGDGDREFAEAVYQRISDSLTDISPDDGSLVTITLDDRAPRTGGVPES